MRPFQQAARDFVVWRAGKSVNWRCTYTAIAKETNLPKQTVRAICVRRGWRCLFEDDANEIRIQNSNMVKMKDTFSQIQQNLDHFGSHV